MLWKDGVDTFDVILECSVWIQLINDHFSSTSLMPSDIVALLALCQEPVKLDCALLVDRASYSRVCRSDADTINMLKDNNKLKALNI